MAENFTLRVNGAEHSVTVEPDTPLLYVLRNDLGLKSAKYGCGEEQCGACSVIVDGERAFSCSVPINEVTGKDITTLEGLGTKDAPHALQTAFIEEQAAQCGYCTKGIAGCQPRSRHGCYPHRVTR
jgi:nicotinate dehydrogenase subunit A